MQLPPELMDQIFSFLRKDTQTLKACLEAHPVYSGLAERYLYMDIIVDTPWAVSEFLEQFSENSRLLDYPRTLEIHGYLNITPLSIVPMISRMSNLVSLRLTELSFSFDNEEFITWFTTYLQKSSIEQLGLSFLYNFPLSVLDNGKSIKKLTVSDCSAKEEPISSFPSSQQYFETLILSGDHNPELHFWAMHRVSRLTSLGLHYLSPSMDLDWTAFLTACPNVTTLHIGIGLDGASTSPYDTVDQVGHWTDDHPQLSLALSALGLLKSLSIFAPIWATTTSIECPLPEIIRLINTAPAIEHITLTFRCKLAGSLSLLGRLDWSLLDRLQSNSSGSRPRIDLCITVDGSEKGPSFSPESIRRALLGNKVLMGLVKRGLVILKSERTLALWEG